MKNYFAPIVIASALTISVVVIRQKAQAQNTSPQPSEKAGATIADAVATRTNNYPATAGSIFVTEIPPGYRDWTLISVAHEEGNLNDDGKSAGDAALQTCFPCHQAIKSRDLIFTRYSP